MDAGAQVFRSRSHPGDDPWAMVYGRALLRAVAACLLPVMIATLVAALQGYAVQPAVWVATGVALVLASLWTGYRLQRRVAEIRVGDDAFAAVLSVWEAARARPPVEWQPVVDLRDYGRWCFATVGLASYELEADEWPEYDALRRALRSAHQRSPESP